MPLKSSRQSFTHLSVAQMALSSGVLWEAAAMTDKMFYYALVACVVASGLIAQGSVLVAGVTV